MERRSADREKGMEEAERVGKREDSGVNCWRQGAKEGERDRGDRGRGRNWEGEV
jgi:hypothetical protein